jgi:hypothetical protein
MIEVMLKRLLRHCVDGVVRDQGLDVDEVGIGGVLRRGGSPQRTLRASAGLLERVPPGAREEL